MTPENIFNLSVTHILSANRLVKSPVGIITHRKNREQWAFVLKNKGKTVYKVGNKEIVSDSCHPVILPKGCSYSWRCTESGECLIIEFDAYEQAEDIFSFPIADASQIINLFSKIERKLSLKQNSCQLECKAFLYQILALTVKAQNTRYIPSSRQKILKPALNYLANYYYDSEITNDFLASLCGISTVYFRKIFQSVYGISPIKYLQNLRIKKAKDILQSDFNSIGQVAESVGFNSIYHFSKVFRQATNQSPTQYAKLRG